MAIKRNQHSGSFSSKRSSYSSGYGGGYGSGRGASGARHKHASSGFSSSSQINNVAGYGSSGTGAGTGSGKHRARYTGDLGSTGLGGGSGRNNRGGRRSNNKRGSKRTQPTSRMQGNSFLDKGVVTIPASNGDILLTRRHFLYGAAGVGVLAAAGTGAKAYTSAKAEQNAITVLAVPKSAVTESTDLTEVENGGKMNLSAEIELPYGALMWATNDDVAALLLPTETGSPLATVSILRLTSGYYFSIINQAVGAAEGFEMYDVRASAEGVVWTEVNLLEGVWRIYGAPLADASLGTPRLLDQDTDDWETPSLAICGKEAFWQVLPNAQGPKKTSASTLRCASVTGAASGASSTSATAGASDASASASGTSTANSSSAAASNSASTSAYEVVLSSQGRMCTPVYASDDEITVTPRAQTSGVYYQLTVINANTHEIKETMVLPQSMKPLEAGYGETGFMFSFEGIYSYGDGIANLGTYAPKTDARGANYSAAPWFHFARTPSAPPCWCGNYLMVKSTRSVVGVDLASDTYFLLNSISGSDTYGDYLSSTGSRKRILVFSNVNDNATSSSNKYCCARIFTAN